jgi:hypothetical protein
VTCEVSWPCQNVGPHSHSAVDMRLLCDTSYCLRNCSEQFHHCFSNWNHNLR